jgi:predicted nucleotidyltransferase
MDTIIEERLMEIKDRIIEAFNPYQIIIFGSYVYGKPDSDSDVDLLIINVKFPKTYDLLELHKLCLSIDPSFELIGDLLDRLNPYSIGYRSPGEEVTIEESKSTLKAVEEVRHFIVTLLGKRGS